MHNDAHNEWRESEAAPTPGQMQRDYTVSSEHAEDMNAQLFDIGIFLYHFRSAFVRFGWLALLLASLCAGLFCIRAARSYTPMYRTETIMTVDVDISGTTNFYNVTTAKQMAATFPMLLSSTQLFDIVEEDLGVSYLNASISASAVDETNLFTLRVTSSDPVRAYDVMNSVLENYPQIADLVVGQTQLRLIAEPQMPIKPINTLSLGNAAVKGAIAGVLLTLFGLAAYAMLDLTVVNAATIEKRLNGTCLGAIPAATLPGRKKQEGDNEIFDIRDKNLSPGFYEAIRALRHDVQRLCKEKGHKVVLITSTSGNEGKSTVSANLAMSLAKNGARVLLIDCDLRKPALKNHIGYHGETPGLAAVLSKKVSFRDAVTVLPGSNLHVLLSSTYSGNAPELFGTQVMDVFLSSLRGVYDYILLDTAPVALVSDTAQLARHADGLLYIVRQDYVFTSHIYDAVRQLSSSGIDMLGFVLNITKNKGSGTRYGYGYSVYGKYGKYGYGKYGYGKYGPSDKKKRDE